jgi:hypothetical protein
MGSWIADSAREKLRVVGMEGIEDIVLGRDNNPC